MRRVNQETLWRIPWRTVNHRVRRNHAPSSRRIRRATSLSSALRPRPRNATPATRRRCLTSSRIAERGIHSAGSSAEAAYPRSRANSTNTCARSADSPSCPSIHVSQSASYTSAASSGASTRRPTPSAGRPAARLANQACWRLTQRPVAYHVEGATSRRRTASQSCTSAATRVTSEKDTCRSRGSLPHSRCSLGQPSMHSSSWAASSLVRPSITTDHASAGQASASSTQGSSRTETPCSRAMTRFAHRGNTSPNRSATADSTANHRVRASHRPNSPTRPCARAASRGESRPLRSARTMRARRHRTSQRLSERTIHEAGSSSREPYPAPWAQPATRSASSCERPSTSTQQPCTTSPVTTASELGAEGSCWLHQYSAHAARSVAFCCIVRDGARRPDTAASNTRRRKATPPPRSSPTEHGCGNSRIPTTPKDRVSGNREVAAPRLSS
jgi:hypothetical protein